MENEKKLMGGMETEGDGDGEVKLAKVNFDGGELMDESMDAGENKDRVMPIESSVNNNGFAKVDNDDKVSHGTVSVMSRTSSSAMSRSHNSGMYKSLGLKKKNEVTYNDIP